VMADRGIDLSSHRSHRLDGVVLERADLVIGMAREHVREAVVVEPSVWPRAFTLKELVRRAAAVEPRPSGQAVAAWLAIVARGRTTADLVGEDPTDDVADPMGRALRHYRDTADEIEHLLESLVERAWTGAAGGRGAA